MGIHSLKPLRLFLALAGLAAAGAFWFLLAPASIGGSADYAVIYGISMEPHLHRGDLAILHPRSQYKVGEVVGYHNRELGRVVLHRIVGRDGALYLFKGDNNSFVDADHPTRSDLVGQLWLRVPNVGNVLSWARIPAHASLVSGLATIPFLLLGGGSAASLRKRRRRRSVAPARVKPANGYPLTAKGYPLTAKGYAPVAPSVAVAARALLGPSLIVLLVCGLLTAAAHRHATTHVVDLPGAYVQQGAYLYSAHALPDAVYPGSEVGTGQTIFSRLVHRINVGFSYHFVSAKPHTVAGTAGLRLVLASSLGWTRTLPRPASVSFQGDTVQLRQSLDVAAVEGMLNRYLRETGVANDTFTLTLIPDVKVQGLVAGAKLRSSFDPAPLVFIVDQSTFRIAHPELGSTSPGQAPSDQLRPSAVGTSPQTEPSTMKILVLHPRVTTVRRLALLGLLGSGAILLLAALAAALASRACGELGRIRRRYGHLIVPVATPPAVAHARFVDVESFDGLVQIAMNQESVILHGHETGIDAFYLVDNACAYRYRACLK